MPIAVAQWSKLIFPNEISLLFIWKSRSKFRGNYVACWAKFPPSAAVWEEMLSAGVGPLCFINFKVGSAVHQKTLQPFNVPSTDELNEDDDFDFQHDLAAAHVA